MKMDMPDVIFDNYMLRTLKRSDYLDYFEIGKNSHNIKFLTWRAFNKKKEAKEMLEIYMRRELKHEPIGYAIVDLKTNHMIGIIEFHTFDYLENQAEVGYLLREDYWNLGIMSRALGKLIEVGFDYLELDAIIVRSLRENIASIKVIKNNNLEYVDTEKNAHYHEKTKTLHDILTYKITKERYYESKTKGNL
ncbi:MAG: GNAT family N-acetyltransferase [Acholeplasmataceae bacterium]|nr:GNAT family N-acetyltransferase [Acholeplasmataceae bacterium]